MQRTRLRGSLLGAFMRTCASATFTGATLHIAAAQEHLQSRINRNAACTHSPSITDDNKPEACVLTGTLTEYFAVKENGFGYFEI